MKTDAAKAGTISRMRIAALALAAAALLAGPVAAQDEADKPVEFAGGKLTISETAEGEKVLSFDGRKIAKNYVVFFERLAEVGGAPIALYEVGDGGNACGANTVIVWKPEGGDLTTVTAGQDCGSPPPAVTDSAVYFVPFLLPGESQPVQIWTPDGGMKSAGQLSFAPQAGTVWGDLDPTKLGHIMEAFDNADVFAAAQKLLGKNLTDVATGLSVGGGVETLKSGIFYSFGCVPHACGSADAFMAVDARGKKLFFAQQGDGKVAAWPKVDGWPQDLRKAMQEAIAQ